MKFTTLLMVAGLVLAAPLAQAQQTSIRDDFGGKRILYVDGNTIRSDFNGKRLLYIDQDGDIRPEPGGKRLFMIDQDGDIRHSASDVRLACWDHDELRRTPGGKRLGLVDEKFFRPEPGFKKYFYMDGDALSHVQITAVISILKPELLEISAEQQAAKEKEMAANGAAEDARVAADQFPGDHPILSHNSTTGATRKGTVQVAKQGDFYAITLKTGDNPVWRGIGIKVTPPGGDPELWAGVAPDGAVSLGVYTVKGGNLTGTWIPINAKDKSVFGYENLVGSASIGGVYNITSGKLPNGGVAYTGQMNIDPLSETLDADAPCFRFRWTTGTTALAFRVKDTLGVVAGWGADYEILRLQQNHYGGLQGDFLGKTGAKGAYNLDK